MFCMVFLENRIEEGRRQPSHLISSLDKSHGYVEEEEKIILVKSEFWFEFWFRRNQDLKIRCSWSFLSFLSFQFRPKWWNGTALEVLGCKVSCDWLAWRWVKIILKYLRCIATKTRCIGTLVKISLKIIFWATSINDTSNIFIMRIEHI